MITTAYHKLVLLDEMLNQYIREYYFYYSSHPLNYMKKLFTTFTTSIITKLIMKKMMLIS